LERRLTRLVDSCPVLKSLISATAILLVRLSTDGGALSASFQSPK
jgi:hypothetical protein